MVKGSLKTKKTQETWYLSGPISGRENYNTAEFGKQEKQLRARGYKIVNPCRLPHLSTWAACLKRDIKRLVDCKGIFVLKEWQTSRGAVLEVFLATILEMPVKDSYTLKPISKSVVKLMVMLFGTLVLARKSTANT